MPKNNQDITIKARHVKTVVAALANFGMSAPNIARITGLNKSAINNMVETGNDETILRAHDRRRTKDMQVFVDWINGEYDGR